MTDREARVAAATRAWGSSLSRLGGRGSLVQPEDPRRAHLDLTGADETALGLLLSGRPVRLRSLVRDAVAHAAALRRLRAVRDEARLFAEEHGVAAGSLAAGVATWSAPRGEPRAAAVLVVPVGITARTASEDDFTLEVRGPARVNPLLADELRRDHGVELDAPARIALSARDATAALFERLTRSAAPVPSFQIAPRLLVGTCTDAAVRLAEDFGAAGDLLAASDAVAALAGDPAALAGLACAPEPDLSAPDRLAPEEEFLLLPADAAQCAAIRAGVGPGHLVIEGGPGTGRAWTATNLVAAAVAAGQRVLVLSAKRAAADALLRRIDAAGLGAMAVDAADDGVADRLEDAVAGAAHPLPSAPVLDTLRLSLLESRQRLAAAHSAMHTERSPWGVSVYAAVAGLLALPAQAATRVRLRGPELRALDAGVVAEMSACVSEWAALGGTTLTAMDTPWYGAAVGTPAQAEKAGRLAAALADATYPAAAAALGRALADSGLAPAATVTDWRRALDLLRAVAETERVLSEEVWAAPLAELVRATAEPGGRRQHGDRPGWQDRMAARRAARRLWRGERPSDAQLHEALVRALAVHGQWSQLARADRRPRALPGLAEAERRYAELLDGLAELALYLPDRHFAGLAPAVLDKALRQLADDPVLARLPRLGELSARCTARGLRPLLVDLHTRRLAPELAAPALSFAWLSSILEEVAEQDPVFGGHDGEALRAAAATFRQADADHVASTGPRLARLLAERLAATVAARSDQATAIRAGEARDPAGSRLRALLALGSDVVLAAAPCWVLSPWQVPAVLPAARLFDLVLVLDAHQLPVPVVAGGLARAARAVLVGDRRQVPAVEFGPEPGGPGGAEGDRRADFDEPPQRHQARGEPSVLDALAPVLPRIGLHTSYRPADERLVGFVAATVYGGTLRTFPAPAKADPITHVLVPHRAGVPGQQESVTAEVQKVVGLVLDAAVRAPEQSLGVVTLGVAHAERVAAALRVALVGRPELSDVFRADAPERFFVKPCAHVQGEVRDAIVFTTGLGKNPDGRVPYRFGPLDADGGERLLATGLTRARARMTVVTSLASGDLDPARLRSAGSRLLRALLRYVEVPALRSTPYAEPPPPDGLDLDLRHRLRAAGMAIATDCGVGAQRIPVALPAPDDPDRYVLAVETDGPRAAALATVRDRERIVPEHLARLGWAVHTVYAADWLRDPDGQIAALRTAYEAARHRAGPRDFVPYRSSGAEA